MWIAELLNYFIRNASSLILICFFRHYFSRRVSPVASQHSGSSQFWQEHPHQPDRRLQHLRSLAQSSHDQTQRKSDPHWRKHSSKSFQIPICLKSTLQFCLKIAELLIYRSLRLTPEEKAIFKQTSFITSSKFFPSRICSY